MQSPEESGVKSDAGTPVAILSEVPYKWWTRVPGRGATDKENEEGVSC